MIINGTDDTLVPYNGGEVQFFFRKLGKIKSVNDSYNKFFESNLCKQTVETTINKVDIFNAQSCKNKSEVILYKVNGGGHTWPGSKQLLPKFIVGKTNYDIDATQLIKKFFVKHLMD
ncbi:MAG: hypothetical protein COB02_05285 [Candidatus Cloacimonadota bacterium]|nr:MAG: hypothetical protein COB02_05285 [Candidatus Cloacimonadota bacterium]